MCRSGILWGPNLFTWLCPQINLAKKNYIRQKALVPSAYFSLLVLRQSWSLPQLPMVYIAFCSSYCTFRMQVYVYMNEDERNWYLGWMRFYPSRSCAKGASSHLSNSQSTFLFVYVDVTYLGYRFLRFGVLVIMALVVDYSAYWEEQCSIIQQTNEPSFMHTFFLLFEVFRFFHLPCYIDVDVISLFTDKILCFLLFVSFWCIFFGVR